MVLGLLLEGAWRLPVDAKARQRWKAFGGRELAVRAAHSAAPAVPAGQDIAGPPATAVLTVGEVDRSDLDGTVHTSGEDTTEGA
jgi:hypothetical protein